MCCRFRIADSPTSGELGFGMVVVGSVVLLAFGSASADVPIAALAPRRGGALRILDQVHVVRETNGQVRLVRSGAGPLRHLFDGGDAQAAEPWELRSAREIGIELDTVEGLAEQIPRGTAALVVLAELTAATELCERALASGGFPIATGLLEPETMLVFGPQLANAVAASKAVEVTTAARAPSALPRSRVATYRHPPWPRSSTRSSMRTCSTRPNSASQSTRSSTRASLSTFELRPRDERERERDDTDGGNGQGDRQQILRCTRTITTRRGVERVPRVEHVDDAASPKITEPSTTSPRSSGGRAMPRVIVNAHASSANPLRLHARSVRSAARPGSRPSGSRAINASPRTRRG